VKTPRHPNPRADPLGQFLDAESKAAFEVAPVEGRRFLAEQLAPLLLQLGYRKLPATSKPMQLAATGALSVSHFIVRVIVDLRVESRQGAGRAAGIEG
jgi:hypothetical protein